MERPLGNLLGLKHQQVRQLERLYRRKVPPGELVTPELARQLTEISWDLHRQVGLLVDRTGAVACVIVGDAKGLLIPELPRMRGVKGRLKGLRLIHTHLDGSPLSHDDLMDLALLRLDAVAALTVNPGGLPGAVEMAHLLPQAEDGRNWTILKADHVTRLKVDFDMLVTSLEEELARVGRADGDAGRERAILIGVSGKNRAAAEDSLAELTELAQSAGLAVAAAILQQRPRFDPRFLMGKGRLSELVIQALQAGSDLLVFDAELSPSQVRSITDFTELKVIDRTQLILDLFAQRARSREGKLQVEMAQVKYLLPRLRGRDDALSRLTGGIGGRGPGETRLEIDRRRLQERLQRLQEELNRVRAERRVRRGLRRRHRLPVLSIIGYTNAGKSTLFNALTHAAVPAEDRLFATLDPTSRRLRFPREREVIITDTVGFIRNLPKNLLEAFKATLEELEDADLLIHVIDLSNPRFEEQMAAVDHILASLGLTDKPVLKVFNKLDRVDPRLAALQARLHQGVAISALDPATLPPLLTRLEDQVSQVAQTIGLHHWAPTPEA
ncbi:MAG: GTPase HflX [Deltaproteobacteria bacterium]|nr:GTPase HflX [Deltaproteobacteria bacterium]